MHHSKSQHIIINKYIFINKHPFSNHSSLSHVGHSHGQVESLTLNEDDDVEDNVRLVMEDNDNIEAFFRRLVSDP